MGDSYDNALAESVNAATTEYEVLRPNASWSMAQHRRRGTGDSTGTIGGCMVTAATVEKTLREQGEQTKSNSQSLHQTRRFNCFDSSCWAV